jgi:hypothetical protein
VAESAVPIRYAEPEEAASLQHVAADVAKVLTPNEEILYIATQNATAAFQKKDSAVATNNRVILYRPHLLGQVDFTDFQWQDVQNTKLEQGILSSELTVTMVDGRTATLSNLNKDQAKRLYGICQQLEQEWREKRRVRHMEEERARSGGIQMNVPFATPSGSTDEDSVTRLAKAKSMLDQGLISEAEYDTLKAKILSAM